MDETEVKTRRTEIDHKKMEYMNFAHNEEITYWKKAALDGVLNEREEKELVDLAPPRVLLIRKENIEKTVNINEIIFYLEYIDDIPTDEPSFEAMTNRLKIFQIVSKMMKILA